MNEAKYSCNMKKITRITGWWWVSSISASTSTIEGKGSCFIGILTLMNTSLFASSTTPTGICMFALGSCQCILMPEQKLTRNMMTRFSHFHACITSSCTTVVMRVVPSSFLRDCHSCVFLVMNDQCLWKQLHEKLSWDSNWKTSYHLLFWQEKTSLQPKKDMKQHTIHNLEYNSREQNIIINEEGYMKEKHDETFWLRISSISSSVFCDNKWWMKLRNGIHGFHVWCSSWGVFHFRKSLLFREEFSSLELPKHSSLKLCIWKLCTHRMQLPFFSYFVSASSLQT